MVRAYVFYGAVFPRQQARLYNLLAAEGDKAFEGPVRLGQAGGKLHVMVWASVRQVDDGVVSLPPLRVLPLWPHKLHRFCVQKLGLRPRNVGWRLALDVAEVTSTAMASTFNPELVMVRRQTIDRRWESIPLARVEVTDRIGKLTNHDSLQWLRERFTVVEDRESTFTLLLKGAR